MAAGLTAACLIAILFAASVLDWRRRKIPNALIVLGFIVGLLFATAGLSGLTFAGALAGALTGLGLFLPLYALKMLGAGDAKLMAVVGTFTGMSVVPWIALYTLLSGGVLAFAMLLAFGGWGSALNLIQSMVSSPIDHLKGASNPLDREAPHFRLPYALAILGGLLTWLVVGPLR